METAHQHPVARMPSGDASFWLISGPSDDGIDVEVDPRFTLIIMGHGYAPTRIDPPCGEPGWYCMNPTLRVGASYPLIVISVENEHAEWFLRMPARLVDTIISEVCSVCIGEPAGHA